MHDTRFLCFAGPSSGPCPTLIPSSIQSPPFFPYHPLHNTHASTSPQTWPNQAHASQLPLAPRCQNTPISSKELLSVACQLQQDVLDFDPGRNPHPNPAAAKLLHTLPGSNANVSVDVNITVHPPSSGALGDTTPMIFSANPPVPRCLKLACTHETPNQANSALTRHGVAEQLHSLQKDALVVALWNLEHADKLFLARASLTRHMHGLPPLTVREKLAVDVILSMGQVYQEQGQETRDALALAVHQLAAFHNSPNPRVSRWES